MVDTKLKISGRIKFVWTKMFFGDIWKPIIVYRTAIGGGMPFTTETL